MPQETIEQRAEKQVVKGPKIPDPCSNCKDKTWFCTNVVSCSRLGEYFEALQNPEYAIGYLSEQASELS